MRAENAPGEARWLLPLQETLLFSALDEAGSLLEATRRIEVYSTVWTVGSGFAYSPSCPPFQRLGDADRVMTVYRLTVVDELGTIALLLYREMMALLGARVQATLGQGASDGLAPISWLAGRSEARCGEHLAVSHVDVEVGRPDSPGVVFTECRFDSVPVFRILLLPLRPTRSRSPTLIGYVQGAQRSGPHISQAGIVPRNLTPGGQAVMALREDEQCGLPCSQAPGRVAMTTPYHPGPGCISWRK